jgi:two-component sensor histidine kinase
VGMSGPLRLRNVLEAITGSVQRTFGCPIALVVDGPTPQAWALPEAESIPIALALNELLTNAIKHRGGDDAGSEVSCHMDSGDSGVQITIANAGRLPEGFNLSRYPGGVSGLGLIRALLPRRSASLGLVQVDNRVVATVAIKPPGVTRLDDGA